MTPRLRSKRSSRLPWCLRRSGPSASSSYRSSSTVFCSTAPRAAAPRAAYGGGRRHRIADVFVGEGKIQLGHRVRARRGCALQQG